MKIIFASQIFLPLQMTRAIQVHRVASALHQAGVEVHLVAGIDRNAKNSSTLKMPTDFSYPVHFIEYGSAKSAKWNHWNEVFHTLLPQWSVIPPEFIRNALPMTLGLINEVKPDLILTSSTPILSHVLGLKVKKFHPQLPWMAFFSDAYPFGLRPAPYQRATCAVPFQMGTIKAIMTQIDAIATPTSRMSEWFATTYEKWLKPEKVFSVRPCGDYSYHVEKPASIVKSETDIPEFQEMDQWMLHTGVLDHYRLHPEMVHAIAKLHEKYPGEFKGLLCIGRNSQKFRMKIDEMGASHCIKTLPWRSLEDIRFLLTQSLCNCVIDIGGDYSFYLQSKLPDYVAAKRPIFSITAKVSIMRDFAQQFENVIAVSPNVDEIFNTIETLILKKRACDITCELPTDLVDYFSEQNIAQLYVDIFETLLKNSKG